MKVTIKEDNKEYVINLEQITQLCGKNFALKSFIKTSIAKYFSTSKYQEYEIAYIDNVLIDNQLLGRKYFKVYEVNTREDLIKNIVMSKDSLMNSYIKNNINEMLYQMEIDRIEYHLEQIFSKLNSNYMKKLGDLQMKYETDDLIATVLDKATVMAEGKYLQQMKTVDLFNIYLNLLMELQKTDPCKQLIVIDNIDHLINKEEYNNVFDKIAQIAKNSDSWFVILSSMENFINLNEKEYFEGINIVNGIIYSLPPKEILLEFIKNNYPSNIDDEKAIYILEKIPWVVDDIGNENVILSMEAEILLKLINKTLCINSKSTREINKMEYAFLTE